MLMRATTILSLMLVGTISSLGQTRPTNLKPGSVEAMAFFERIEDRSFDDYLRRVRLPKVSPAFKAEVMTRLAISDEIKPSERMSAKLSALAPALRFHERDKIVGIKIVNLPHAFVGLQGRAALLISEKALSLLSTEELLAVVAHEMGHDYFWGGFVEARQRKQYETMRELELRSDAIAVITMLRLGIDPAKLISRLLRMNDFNARVVNTDNRPYPSSSERFKFIRAMTEMAQSRNTAETIAARR